MQSQRRRKATSVRRVLRAARSNLGGTDRIKADFRNLGEHLWQFSLPIELFSCRTALAVCRHRAPCKPSSVIGTSVSLRRIDRACYQDRCDAHSDTSVDTYSPTRRDAKRSRREPQEGDHTASRSVDHVARSMPASAWRTPWTVAKPKTPAVAVRWRERRRSRPHPSRRRPNLTRNRSQPDPTNPTQQPNPKSTILKLGPQAVDSGAVDPAT